MKLIEVAMSSTYDLHYWAIAAIVAIAVIAAKAKAREGERGSAGARRQGSKEAREAYFPPSPYLPIPLSPFPALLLVPEAFNLHNGLAIAAVIAVLAFLSCLLSTPAAAAEVASEEALLEMLFQQLDAGVLVTGPQGEVRRSNPAAWEMLGVSETELLGKIAFDERWEIIAEDGTPLSVDASPIALAIATASPARNLVIGIRNKAEGRSETALSHFVPHESAYKWLLVNANPQQDASGRVVQVICTCSDISDRIRQQMQLRSEKDNYRRLCENAAQGLFQIAPDGRYLYANLALARFYGCDSLEELLNALTDENRQLYVDPQRGFQFIKQLLQRDFVANFESEIFRKDGSIIWISENVRAVRDAKGGLLYYEGSVTDITERKRAEELERRLIASLQKSEDRLHHLAGKAGAIYQCRLGADGFLSFPFVSGDCRELCELAPEDIIADANALIDLIHPDDRQRWEESLAVAAGTMTPWEWEGRLIVPSGDIKWLQNFARPEIQEDGDILWDGLLADITARKQAEEAFQKQAQKLSLHFQQTPLAAISWSLTFEVTEWNPAAERIFGYSKAEALGRHLLELLVPETARERVEQECSELLSRGDGIRSTRENVTKEGGIIICEWYNTPLVDATGNAIGFASLAEDITERKRAEEALRESEQRFRAIAIATPIPILISRGSDGEVMYANPALSRALGVGEEDGSARHTIDFYENPTDRQKVLAVLEKDGCVRGLEMRAKRADGTVFWISLSVQPLTFNGCAAMLAAFYDITERKRVEEILRSRSRLSTLAAEIGVALVQSSTLPEIFHRCTEAMELCLDVTFAGIWQFNPSTKILELQAFAGEQPAATEFGDRILLGVTLIGFIAQYRQPYLTAEVADGNSSSIQSLESFLAGYPLIVEERLVGVMALVSRAPYTEADRSMLSWVAGAIAVATDRLLAREELLSRREALLFHLASQIRTSLEIDTILETSVREIRSFLQVDRCLFMWYVPSKNSYLEVVNEAKNPELNSSLGRYRARAIAKITQKLLNQEIIRVDDVETVEEPILKKFATSMHCASMLALPIHTRGGAIGAIGCGHHQEARPWDDSEVELLQAVAAQLAIALDQAELYAQSVNAASVARAKAEQLEQALQELKQTQAQLIQTEKMSSLGQLVAGVAHEINNPVNFIYANLSYAHEYAKDLLSLIELYQREYSQPGPKIQEKIAAIDLGFLAEDLPKIMCSMQVGAERIRQIVLSLRNFSRLDEADMKKVDLHEGIDNTLLILQNRLKPNGAHPGIEIIKEYGQLPAVECYAGQLNQVFLNILSNALDALEIENKLGKIIIRTEFLTSRGSSSGAAIACSLVTEPSVAIRIIDNGPGMSQEVKERLFDPFFTTKPVGKGTGLGLSIAYQIVNKHKGVLNCFSEPGRGAEFCIEIPIRQSDIASGRTPL